MRRLTLSKVSLAEKGLTMKTSSGVAILSFVYILSCMRMPIKLDIVAWSSSLKSSAGDEFSGMSKFWGGPANPGIFLPFFRILISF